MSGATSYSKTSTIPLTDQPKEVAPGIRAWKNPGNKFAAVLLHFSADPNTAGADARREGMSEEGFNREHNLDFTSWSGKPAIPGYVEETHGTNPFWLPHLPVWRGWDFGFHRPSLTYAQAFPVGDKWALWVHGELLGEDCTLERFLSDWVEPYEEALFGDWPGPKPPVFIDAADPAGKQVSDKSEHTSFAILSNHGIFPFARKTEISEGLTLLRTTLLVEDGLRVHERCPITREGLRGGYRYPDPSPSNPEPRYPLKDGYYEHVFDTLRYICVNAMSLHPPRRKKQEKEPTIVQKVLASQKRRRRYIDPDLGLS